MISLLLQLLAPKVHAENIEQLGATSPGVSAMWAIVKNTFPHTDLGKGGLLFILLKITDIILKTIGAVAVIVMLWAAIKIITGGEEGVTEGKKIVLYAVVGLIAAMCADALVLYVQVIVNQLSQ